MNAAVKALTNRTMSLWSISIQLSRQQIRVLILAILVLFSAFGLIYLKDMNRRLMIQYEMMQSDQEELHNQWTKLLLEKSALASQYNIAQTANQKLQMTMPAADKVVMIRVS